MANILLNELKFRFDNLPIADQSGKWLDHTFADLNYISIADAFC